MKAIQTFSVILLVTVFLSMPALAQTKENPSLLPMSPEKIQGQMPTLEQQSSAMAIIESSLQSPNLNSTTPLTAGSPFIPFVSNERLVVMSRVTATNITVCVYNNRQGGPVDGCMYYPEIGAGASFTVAGKPNFYTQFPDYLVYIIFGNQVYSLVHGLQDSWDTQRPVGTIYSAVVVGPQLIAQLWKVSRTTVPSEVYINGTFVTPDKYRIDTVSGSLNMNLTDPSLGLAPNTLYWLIIKNNGRYSSTVIAYQQ